HIPQPRISTLFPYTTLFRSNAEAAAAQPRGHRAPRRRGLPHHPGGAAPPCLERRLLRRGFPRRRGRAGDGARIALRPARPLPRRSEEHTSELQSLTNLVCRL